FRRLWSEGQPIIVACVDRYLQGSWDPDYFSQSFGAENVSVVDCETNRNYRTTVRSFFEDFGAKDPSNCTILKLKDWPPQTEFKTKFAHLYQDLIQATPAPDLTQPDGVWNLVAHFPLNGVVPDLGPKMYNAYGTQQDDHHHGSTRLHMDVTSAINLMLFATPEDNGALGGAIWHIFPRSATPQLRRFLSETLEKGSNGDPIHNQQTYLTPSMLGRLRSDYGVSAYTIRQCPGEAIFIPAGCAHQVSLSY
ncbi:hypothetical protein GLOTRDRAFT_30135, partial [Gloeophyllum trabeum ATCC 11539]